MNVKFHNKLEIYVGDKSYICYNKVLSGIYKKLASLEPYFSYFALGNGKVELDVSATKLTNHLYTLPAVTNEISCDPSNGVYYIKKSATLPSNDSSIVSFSEIGIASDNTDNPDIYNHIVVKDQDGNPVDVVKNEGESLEIRLTIFLELSIDTQGLLTKGDNNLIKLLLGESLSDKTITVVRGNNLTENILTSRCIPRYTESYETTVKSSLNTDGLGATITISAKLGEGATREVVYILGGQVIARQNVMDSRDNLICTLTLTSSKNSSIIVGSDIKSISSVADASSMQEVENIYAKKIFKEFSDYVELPEISNYLNATKFVAKDGKHIAFLDSDSLAIFACADKSLVRVHTGAVDPIGITNVCMVKNLVVVIKNISPYIEIYKIENNVCVNQDVYKVSYDESSYSYDFKAVDCTLFGENELFIGVIINGTNTGLVLRFVDTYDGFILTSINQNSLGQTTNVYAAIKDNNCNGKIIFLTNAYDNPVFSSAIQVFDGTMNSAGAFSQAEEFIGASNITVHGKWLLMHTLESPYAYSYDTETFSRVSIFGIPFKKLSLVSMAEKSTSSAFLP